jgi:hypothetical protein
MEAWAGIEPACTDLQSDFYRYKSGICRNLRTVCGRQPIGERSGLMSKKATARTGEKERCSAGPDGPDARETTRAIKPAK